MASRSVWVDIQRLNATSVAGWTVFMRAMLPLLATITAKTGRVQQHRGAARLGDPEIVVFIAELDGVRISPSLLPTAAVHFKTVLVDGGVFLASVRLFWNAERGVYFLQNTQH